MHLDEDRVVFIGANLALLFFLSSSISTSFFGALSLVKGMLVYNTSNKEPEPTQRMPIIRGRWNQRGGVEKEGVSSRSIPTSEHTRKREDLKLLSFCQQSHEP